MCVYGLACFLANVIDGANAIDGVNVIDGAIVIRVCRFMCACLLAFLLERML